MQLTKIMTSFHNCSRKWICQFDRNLDIYSFCQERLLLNLIFYILERYLISLIHFRISTLPLCVLQTSRFPIRSSAKIFPA